MQTYSLLFYLKKAKGNVQTSTIYIRLTVDGKRKEFSTGRTIRNKDWNAKGGKVVGNSPASKSLNLFLESLRTKIFDSYNSLFNSGKTITSKSLKNKFLGIDERNFTLLEVFGNHNDEMEELIGKGYSEGTWERYETSLRHVQEFLMWKYKISDINLSEIKPSFISNFDFFLRTVRKCANNTAIKYIKNFKKIMRLCMANGWLSKDPFLGYKAKLKSWNVLISQKKKSKRFMTKNLHQRD
ncbi:phage integrase SAM-like domain and Arm DNA-binding domain-containing protein [Epilithonimonas sp.]|uniref:phage integrase SAM-like domain and Arm DNA-binding domain-containing protein n=1 Tax=Epilithonimonas sp. TaxID=2894511 RepID=UPI00289ECA23|nr:phage integrase SAM-like domain and Arm DNA-binding domain-containing protein [Epilithonimonas sp.]